MSRESTSPAASSFLAVAEATIPVLPASAAPDIVRAARSDFTSDMYWGTPCGAIDRTCIC